MLIEKYQLIKKQIRTVLFPVFILSLYVYLLSWIDLDLTSYLLNLLSAIVAVSVFVMMVWQQNNLAASKIIDLEQLLAEEILAKQRADEANLSKSKFIAAASHDLRQPLHAQGLFLSMLANTALTQNQSEIIANLSAVTKDSCTMLDALTEFSRIEAGLIKPHIQAFHLQDLLSKLEGEFAAVASAKEISYKTRDTKLIVQTDPELIESILSKLIANAIQYTESGWLLVVGRKRGNNVVLEVRDTGAGIHQKNLPDVLQQNKLSGVSQRDGRKGLGLGLTIADGLARRLNTELILTSAPKGGCVFRIALPIALGDIPKVNPYVSQIEKIKLNVRVLIIEDNKSSRAYMQQLLEHWGCQCDAAESVTEALAMARENKPELLISDYRLSEIRNGVEAIAAIRALYDDKIPAMLLTGDTAPERVAESRTNNIHLLHKPLSLNELHRGIMLML